MKAVILAGGFGTRLWPLSRENKPKQLQRLIGDKTLLEETIERLDFLEPEDIFIATNEKYLDGVKKNAPGIPQENFIAEPSCRDTAPCIGFAAAYIGKLTSHDEIMAVVYADHLVKNPREFAEMLQAAEKLAREKDTLNIIEVKAKSPNTNLGYVKIGQKLGKVDGHEFYAFEKFVEKPDLKTAEKFLTDGNYLWNTGFYVWRIGRILDEFKKHAPDTYDKIMKMTERGIEKELYDECEKISIDYAIMEKVAPAEVLILPADIGWSDIGTWNSIHEELAKTSETNIVKGKHIDLDSHGCLIYGTSGKPITTIGLKNMIVVETSDSILICPKSRSHEVKQLVEKMKEEKNEHLL